MKAIILKVKPGTQFRLGEGNKDTVSSIIHSDTLFSAITNIYESVYNEGNEFVELVRKSEVLISSCFPCLEIENDIIYFIPKPDLLNLEKEYSKKYKKIEFISISCLKTIADNIKQNDKGNCFLEFDFFNNPEFIVISDTFLINKNEVKLPKRFLTSASLVKTLTTPKNKARFETQEDTIYYEANVQLSPLYNEQGKIIAKTHFYFLLNERLDDENRKKLFTIINILADEGLGGERSAGKGLFEDVILKEFNHLDNLGKKFYFTLSLINPASNEEFNSFLTYDIIKRGGGSIGIEGNASNERMQIRMIKEGAVLSAPVKGQVVDISPENNFYKHKIFRNGMSFLIP